MMTESLAYPGGTRRLSVGEEVLNAVSHGVGALLAVAGTVLLVLRAKAYGGLVNLVGVTVFGVSMILLYLFSCLYHALPPSKGKQVFQVLDHCSIFLLIMGTYAPVCLVTVGGPLEPTAASAFAPTKLPTMMLSAVLYSCCSRLPKISGRANSSRLLTMLPSVIRLFWDGVSTAFATGDLLSMQWMKTIFYHNTKPGRTQEQRPRAA